MKSGWKTMNFMNFYEITVKNHEFHEIGVENHEFHQIRLENHEFHEIGPGNHDFAKPSHPTTPKIRNLGFIYIYIYR